MNRRYLVGIGSNLGDRLVRLQAAVDALAGSPDLTVVRRSGVWETRPMGPGSGPFLNAAVELSSADTQPLELLGRLLEIERQHGRLRRERWGDRTLDLDLLCGYEGAAELVIDIPGLTLPHPEIGARDFVLQPLVDLDPELAIAGRRCADQLAAIPEDQRTLLRRLDVALE
jgi:2-amino-4-hydroxy-6-hydroxymethyldihydropteridine diphosphokinase